MRFLFMVGTQRALGKGNVCEGMERVVEPMWEMERPIPSPITMSSVPLYGLWKKKFLGSTETWCYAPLSNNQLELGGVISYNMGLRAPSGGEARLPWVGGSQGARLPLIFGIGGGGCMFGCFQNIGHWDTTCPWVLHHWHRLRNGQGVGHLSRMVEGNCLVGPDDRFQEDLEEWFLLLFIVDQAWVEFVVASSDVDLIF